MKNVLKSLALFLAACVTAYFTSPYFGAIFTHFQSSGGFFYSESLLGLPLAYIFFVTVLFVGLESANKKLFIFLLIPAIIIESFDILHIYVPLIVLALGWFLGLGLEKLIKIIRKPKATQIQ